MEDVVEELKQRFGEEKKHEVEEEKQLEIELFSWKRLILIIFLYSIILLLLIVATKKLFDFVTETFITVEVNLFYNK